jgi:hypothetical protein
MWHAMKMGAQIRKGGNMQIGEKKKVKHYPIRVPKREAIPAPDIFVPKKAPVKVPERVER